MKTALQWLGGLAGLAAILALGVAVQSWYFRPLAIGIFFERAFLQFLLEDPEAVSSLGVFEQLGYKGFDGMLTDVSPAHERKLAQMARDIQSKLLGVELMVKLKKLDLPGIDLHHGKQLARAAAKAIREGLLGYTLIVATCS